MKRPAHLAAGLAVFLYFMWAAAAHAHWSPGLHNTRHAINLAWCGKSNAYCYASSQAWRVADCETGGTFSVWANNGQYLGLFQMGAWARGRYGHSHHAWGQARAAHKNWLENGWGQWECASILGIR